MLQVGQGLLLLTFLVASGTGLAAAGGALARNESWTRAARYGAYAVAILAIAMAIILTHGFLTHDFSSKYISTYSDRAMPTLYLLAAFWGGEQGALLFWTTSLSVFSAIALHLKRRRDAVYMAWVTTVLMGALLFFIGLMLFATSPFDQFVTTAGMMEGKGLNPLLQNPTMAFHPPSLLTGYIAFTIPFAFAVGALISGKLDAEWITDTRVWTLISWIFLSVGLLLGALWAYEEIGWGFWWMWDPVENAGLIPWFTATAFLHSALIQERRGMLKRWNAVLVCITFFLTIFGTFLTRSQIIDSIHSFANSKLATSFVWYLVVLAILSVVLLAWRWRALKAEARIESFWSRESFFVLNNVVLVGCAFIVLWGTLFPKLSALPLVQNTLNGLASAWNSVVGDGLSLNYLTQAVSLDEPWFNKVMAPLGLVLLFLMAVGPLIAWRRATVRNFNKTMKTPLLISTGIMFVVLLLVLLGRGDDASPIEDGHVYAFICYLFSCFVLITLAREFHSGARIRQRKFGESYLGALVALVFKAPQRYGGYVVHLGMMLMFIAFTGKVFKTEIKDRPMNLGQTLAVEDYRLTFSGRNEAWHEDDGYAAATATITVLNKGETVAEAEVDALADWLQSRDIGAFHIRTRVDSPKMVVHFAQPDARDVLRDDLFLARQFRVRFKQVPSPDPTRLSYRLMDNGLLTTVPRLAMQQLREAKQALGPASTINAEVTIRGGSTDLHLQFSDATEASAFVERLGAIEVPSTLTYSRFDAASGALEFIDLNTGHQLNPEVRYYQAKRAGEPPPQTTEAAISSMVYEDLYLAMKDMGGMINTLGQPVINLMVVIFPFVAFLWTGGIVLVFGTLICVTPRWLGRTFIDLFRPRHRAGAARVLGAGLAVLLVALFSAQALASESASDKVDAHHHAEQPDVSVEQLLSVLRCPCPSLGGGLEERDDSLAASSCDCARAVLERQVVSEVRESEAAAAGSVSFHAVLERLVALDASWDHRILFDETTFRDLVMSTKTTCPGERGLVLGQAQITCSVRNLWFPRFRQMLASGMSVDAVRRVYVQEENQSSRAPPGGWSYEDLRADPDKPMAWIFPTGVLLGVLGMFLGIRLRRARAKTPVSERRARPMTGLNASDRLRLEDELDAL